MILYLRTEPFLAAILVAAAMFASRVVAAEELFEKQVRPLLVKRCYACHSGTKNGGGLSLETAGGWRKGGDSGPAIVPGRPEESLLVAAINYQSLQMPPPDSGGPLPAAEIEILTRWIARGAPDPRGDGPRFGGMTRQEAESWWAFRPLPDADATNAVDHIDRFVQASLDQQGLSRSPPADKRTLIRRATYDLTGLPPTPAEVEAFLADNSAKAFEKVVDRLLESPQYGAHWGRHWLDVVRYADTAGENTDRPLPHAWRYRNWVLEAFQRDLPFDDFVRSQICGDIQGADGSRLERSNGIIATGYLAIARRFGHDIDKDIHLTHEDVIDNLGKSFLGLTLGCARCHDHKYDPITMQDYYGLYGIFHSTRFSFPGCEPKGAPRDLVPLIDQHEVDALQAGYQQELAKYEGRMQETRERTSRMKQLMADSLQVVAESQVGEGGSIPLADIVRRRIAIRKGEVLQLVVRPNGSHGADSTRIEWEITRNGDDSCTWSVADLLPVFTNGGPLIQREGTYWCLLDVTDGPAFLAERKQNLDGHDGLHAWRLGDTPSIFVNASPEPAVVWTTLPGNSFFVHPGVQRNVAVGWICPQDGEYSVRGVVADAHPSQGDGVSFRLDHVSSPEYGAGLVSLGELAGTAAPPPPTPPRFPVAYAVSEAKPENARLQQRGDPEQPGEEVPRRWLAVLGGDLVPANGGSGRRELAEWVVEQPLFARVIVNRIWQWHFGRGLVATPSDFGSRGEAPTHPELLNRLASQFRAGGYQMKPIHRLIMKSAAYQRSSDATPELLEQDPENRWLARFARRRLTAEEIRDSLLMAGEQLDLSPGEGQPFPAESEWKFTQHDPFYAVYETNRRSVYLMVQRQRRHPYLALFDGADPNSSTSVRQSTTVPTQALYFLNDPFFHRQAEALAATCEPGGAVTDRIDGMYRRLFQRDPRTDEVQTARRFLDEYPSDGAGKWSALARVLLASNEFLYLD